MGPIKLMNQFDLLQFSNRFTAFNQQFSDIGFIRREVSQDAYSSIGGYVGKVALVPLEMTGVPAVFPKTVIAIQNRRTTITDSTDHLPRYATLLINGLESLRSGDSFDLSVAPELGTVLMISGSHLFQLQDINHQTLGLLMTLGQKVGTTEKDRLATTLSPALDQFNALLESNATLSLSLSALRDKIAPMGGVESETPGLDLLAFLVVLAGTAKIVQSEETKDTDPGVLLIPVNIRYSHPDFTIIEKSTFAEGFHHQLTISHETGAAAISYWVRTPMANPVQKLSATFTPLLVEAEKIDDEVPADHFTEE